MGELTNELRARRLGVLLIGTALVFVGSAALIFVPLGLPAVTPSVVLGAGTLLAAAITGVGLLYFHLVARISAALGFVALGAVISWQTLSRSWNFVAATGFGPDVAPPLLNALVTTASSCSRRSRCSRHWPGG